MEDEYIVHKVNAGYNYIVYRNEINGHVFYKIGIEQELFDGQKVKAYLQVRFNKGIDIPNKTKIKIKKAIENFYFKKDDPKHYNPIFYLQILEFENLDNAVQDYNESLNQEEDLPF